MRNPNHRNGASLVVVLTLLVVCVAIVLQLVSASLRQRLQLRRDLQRQQTQWLLRAGTEYAAAHSNKPDSELPDTVALEIPRFESNRLSFKTQADAPSTQAITITAQIGNSKNPTQLTSLSAQFKLDSSGQETSQE